MEQRKDYRQVPNLNLMPPEYRKPAVPVQLLAIRALLVVMIAIEALFVLNLNREKSAIVVATSGVQQKIQRVNKKLAEANAIANTNKEEANKIKASIQTLEQGRGARAQDWVEATTQTDWTEVMSTLYGLRPGGLELSSMAMQGTTQVSIIGTVVDYAVLLRYQSALLSSPIISGILDQKAGQAGDMISFSMVIETRIGEK